MTGWESIAAEEAENNPFAFSHSALVGIIRGLRFNEAAINSENAKLREALEGPFLNKETREELECLAETLRGDGGVAAGIHFLLQREDRARQALKEDRDD